MLCNRVKHKNNLCNTLAKLMCDPVILILLMNQ
jgi:hypothetical protein